MLLIKDFIIDIVLEAAPPYRRGRCARIRAARWRSLRRYWQVGRRTDIDAVGKRYADHGKNGIAGPGTSLTSLERTGEIKAVACAVEESDACLGTGDEKQFDIAIFKDRRGDFVQGMFLEELWLRRRLRSRSA